LHEQAVPKTVHGHDVPNARIYIDRKGQRQEEQIKGETQKESHKSQAKTRLNNDGDVAID